MKKGIFETKKEAREYLESLGMQGPWKDGSYFKDGTYYLRHGEYQRPDYIPTYYKSLGGWAVKQVLFFYHNTIGAPKDGPVYLYTEEDTDGFPLFVQEPILK